LIKKVSVKENVKNNSRLVQKEKLDKTP